MKKRDTIMLNIGLCLLILPGIYYFCEDPKSFLDFIQSLYSFVKETTLEGWPILSIMVGIALIISSFVELD